MIEHFLLGRDLAFLTYAMNPPWLVRELDEFEAPSTEDTSRTLVREKAVEIEKEPTWPGHFEPTFG
jgi:hypothetical protein